MELSEQLSYAHISTHFAMLCNVHARTHTCTEAHTVVSPLYNAHTDTHAHARHAHTYIHAHLIKGSVKLHGGS